MPFQQLLPSAARTSSQTITQLGHVQLQSAPRRQVTLVLDVTAVPGTDTVQLVVEHLDAAGRVSSAFAAAPRVAAGKDIMTLGEGQPIVKPTAAAGPLHHSGPVVLGLYQVRVVHSGSGSFTYSLTAAD
jgi:hypothetical protein